MDRSLIIRNVNEQDSKTLEYLASVCPPLDVHTPYTYWVICRYFSETSFIAEYDGIPVGYITGIDSGTEVLVWQIGIVDEMRGKGLSGALIDKIVSLAEKKGRLIHVSIDKSNENSNSAFRSYCRSHRMKMVRLGSVSLSSLVNTDFSENEEYYSIEPISQDDKGEE